MQKDIFKNESVKLLVSALAGIESEQECRMLLEDLLSTKEILDIAQRVEVAKMLSEGHDVLLEIDVQGSLQVLKNMPETIGIFILPPTRAELVRRLSGRGTENRQQLETRIRNAEAEVHAAEQFPYLIVNASLSEAVKQVRSVIEAEHLHDQKDKLQDLYREFEEAHSK